MLTQTLSDFGVGVDVDLDLMQENQSLAALTACMFSHLNLSLAS